MVQIGSHFVPALNTVSAGVQRLAAEIRNPQTGLGRAGAGTLRAGGGFLETHFRQLFSGDARSLGALTGSGAFASAYGAVGEATGWWRQPGQRQTPGLVSFAGLPQPTIGTMESFMDQLQTQALGQGPLEAKIQQEQLKNLESILGALQRIDRSTDATARAAPAWR
jgi:hypothetical protein